MLINAVLSALVNVVLLAGLPFLGYVLYHKWRHKRGFTEIARRAGVQVGEVRYLGYCAILALVCVAILWLWPPSLEASVRQGSAFRSFAGLGLSARAVAMALLYGGVKTGFAEELLFRGLIAGSLSRRLSVFWANGVQASIFLLPHLLLLYVMPEMWGLLPFVFVGALFVGWARIRSGSILGPWLVHAALNVMMALSVAVRSA